MYYEKDISTFKKKKSEQARFQKQNELKEWPKGFSQEESQGQIKALCFWWKKIEVISHYFPNNYGVKNSEAVQFRILFLSNPFFGETSL